MHFNPVQLCLVHGQRSMNVKAIHYLFSIFLYSIPLLDMSDPIWHSISYPPQLEVYLHNSSTTFIPYSLSYSNGGQSRHTFMRECGYKSVFDMTLQDLQIEPIQIYGQCLYYRTRAIISGRSKISMARKVSKISMPKTLKPYFLDIIVDTKA